MKFMLGRLSIDDTTLVIAMDGQAIPAPPKVVELILALGERPGEVLSKEALIERLWPQGYADDATLWQTIYLARKLLAKTGEATIETHPRRGYSVIPSVANVVSEVEGSASKGRAWNRYAIAAAAMLVVAIAVPFLVHRGAPPMSPQALRAFNLGRYYLHQGTAVSVRHAITEFQTVVQSEPANAVAYADLAEAEAIFAENMINGRREMLAHASADASAALRIDPRSTNAQTALAIAVFFAHEPPAKVSAAFKRAIALDDESALSHMYYAEFLLSRGDVRPAYVHLRRTIDLDPSLGDANVMLALAAYKLGDPQTAIHYAREGLGFGAPDKFDAYQTLGYAYVAVGQQESALNAFRQLHDWDAQAGAAGVAYVRARRGGTHSGD